MRTKNRFNMIKAIALDDEPLALNIIKTYCKKNDAIDLVATFTSQNKFLEYLSKDSKINLIFLDIEMPKNNGINLYNSLSQKTKVIFTTAYSNYAVEGFNADASDYLLKPFSFERFSQAITKVKHQILLETNQNLTDDYLLIRADYKTHNIPLKTILFIEAYDDYIKIFLNNNTKIVARQTMKSMTEKLPKQLFTRVHRSYIIAFTKINSVTKETIKINEYNIPIGLSYKKNLTNFLEGN